MNHDPMCPHVSMPEQYVYRWPCACSLIAAVRIDERQRESDRRAQRFGFWHDYRPGLP